MELAVAGGSRKEATTGLRRPKSFPPPQTTLASLESLSLPLVQEVVLLADFQCDQCQKRVSDIISKMSAEMESIEVNVLGKTVTLTCRYPSVIPVGRPAMIARIFRLGCS